MLHEYSLRDSFHFAKESLQPNLDLFIVSLEITSLFTIIPFDEAINICLKFASNFDPDSLKKLLWLAMKVIFNFP